jgi:hypothetical protein
MARANRVPDGGIEVWHCRWGWPIKTAGVTQEVDRALTRAVAAIDWTRLVVEADERHTLRGQSPACWIANWQTKGDDVRVEQGPGNARNPQ